MTQFHSPNKSIETLKDKYSMSPSYTDVFIDIWNTIRWYYSSEMRSNSKSVIYNSTRNYYFDINDIYYIVFIALFITLIRYVFERVICTRMVNWLELTTSDKKKFPESTWKCVFYTCTWSYCFYLIKYRYNYFDKPYLIWDDWSAGMIVPFEIKLLYFVQCGFYIHSIYATLYMDSRRKDFYVMLLHHVLTVTLIFVSYVIRYHKVGLLVLFLHDIADIWLEMTKLMRYLSSRDGGRYYPRWEQASYVGFSLLTLSWFICRLYWYPLKVLYTTGVIAVYRTLDKGLHLYIPFNILLWILLFLNIYWFLLILQILYKVLIGTASKSGDVREDDDDEDNASWSSNNGNTDKKRNV